MADLPRILANASLPQLQLPRIGPDASGENAFATLAQVAEGIAKSGEPIEAARKASEYDDLINDAKNEVATLDPNIRRDEFLKRIEKARATVLSSTSSRNARESVELHIARRAGPSIIDVTNQSLRDTHVQQKADVDLLRSTLAKKAAEADDPATETSLRNIFFASVAGAAAPVTVAGRTMPGALTPREAQAQRESFTKDVLEHYATKIILGNPSAMLTPEVKSRLAPLGEVRILELETKATDKMLKDDQRSDAVTAKNSRIVYDAAEAQAIARSLDKTWLQDALENKNPLIRPQQARELQRINQGGAMGRDDAARAIWDEYTSGPRDEPGRMKRAWEQLNRLPMSDDKLKYKNELQSDMTVIQNQATAKEANQIARENRAIRDLQNEYTAFIESNPVTKALYGNLSERQQAQIRYSYQKDGPQAARKLLDSFKAGIKDKADAVDPDIKGVMDYKGKK